MTKRETTILKGVAILLMLFLHLFNTEYKIDLCQSYVDIAGMPLLSFLVRIANPVPFYIIFSGYGLYLSYCRDKYSNGRRVLKLYIHYWITLVMFVTIGFFVLGKEVYPGTLAKIIENVTAWNPTYNAEIWFLLPYCLVALTSSWLFRLLDHINLWIILIVVGGVYLGACTAIHFWGTVYLYSHRLVYMPIMYLHFLFAFFLGAIMAKYNMLRNVKIGGGIALCLLLLVTILRMCMETGVAHPLYAIAFTILFVKIRRWLWLDNFLYEMGRRSTSMWFVHTYFCVYLFRDFIYSFHYPIVIFLVLLSLSYFTAVIIDWIYTKILVVIHLQ